MTDGLIPTHHEPVLGRSIGPKGTPPKNNASSTANARSSMDGQTVLGSDDQAASLSQTRVRLSASLFPADAALANRGGVPLGAVVHPFRDGETFEGAASSAFPSMTIQKPPTRCETCGAFVNGFCPVNARNGHWACVFCGSGNAHRCLINPVDADAAALPELAAREVEYVFSSRRETDKTTQNADADAALRASRGPSDAIRDESFSTSGNGPVFFVLDESMDADESRLMRRSVCQTLDALPDDKEVGLAAFAGAVSVYDVAASTRKSISALDGVAPVVASVVPGHRSPDAHDLLDVLDETRGGARRFIARLGDEGVRETFAAAVKALAPIRRRGGGDQGAARTRPRSLGAAVETAVAVLESVSSSSGKESEPGKERHKNQNRGRVIVCLGGPPTRGPGAAAADFSSEFYDAEERAARKYVETLAETVASLGVSVDVFCCGREAASASRLAPLAERTGGVVVAEEDFGDAFARDLAAAAARPTPRGAALTIHASKGVRVARLVGAADVMSAEDAARATGAARREKNTALAATAFALRGADDSQSVSAYFEYDGTASLDEPAFVHLQFITWIDCNGIGDENERSARCVTLRVSTTSSAVAYARAVHLPTASLLAARRLVLEAHEDDTLRVGAGSSASSRKNTGASVARIEKCVSRVAEAFSAGADSSPAPFPEALVPFAEAMYHLRRGPMLGVGFGHDDEKTTARLAFLFASHDVAYRSLAPVVYAWNGERNVRSGSPFPGTENVFGEEPFFAKLPALDLALAPHSAIVVDHGAFGAFGWVGRDVGVEPGEASGDATTTTTSSDANANATREAAVEAVTSLATRLARGSRSGSRSDTAGGNSTANTSVFPAPPSLVAAEGSSAARRVVCRLAPAHRDAPHEQDARFPPVRGTSLEARRAFAARAPPTEELTFFQWMRGLGVDAPVTPWAPWR